MIKAKEAMVDGTVKTINAYCRVLELHMKAVAQGGNPNLPNTSVLGKAMKLATEGLAKEVEFLSFLRQDMAERQDYPGA